MLGLGGLEDYLDDGRAGRGCEDQEYVSHRIKHGNGESEGDDAVDDSAVDHCSRDIDSGILRLFRHV